MPQDSDSEQLNAGNSSEGSLLLLLRNRKSSENGGDEADLLSTDLTALLTSAVHDEHPVYSLSAIHHAVTISGVAYSLDALHVIPLLIDSTNPTANDILALLGECGNAKEVVISVQESLERMLHDLLGSEECESSKIYIALERALLLYIGAIPRLKLRKKSASETLKPLFVDLPRVIESASPSLSKKEGQHTVDLIFRLVSSSVSWSSKQAVGSDLANVQTLCRNILISSLGDLSPLLDTGLAQRKFALNFPRLVFGEKTNLNIEDNTFVREWISTAKELSCTLENLMLDRSTGSLTLFAYMLSSESSSIPPPNAMLSALLPVLTASLQFSAAVDASLFILLSALFPSNISLSLSVDLDPDVIAPLIFSLSPLTCTSPDSQIRLIAFRILGALLMRAPPLEHMSLLQELLSCNALPALRVAAVGLLKDAVLASLNASAPAPSAPTSRSPFASPALLRTFGYVVLRPDPTDLFSRPADQASLNAFLDTSEPKRLVECLSFYYVLLMRDTANFTGVREPGQIKSVEKELISPLRNEHAVMALAALETSLERVDDAYKMLNEAVGDLNRM